MKASGRVLQRKLDAHMKGPSLAHQVICFGWYCDDELAAVQVRVDLLRCLQMVFAELLQGPGLGIRAANVQEGVVVVEWHLAVLVERDSVDPALFGVQADDPEIVLDGDDGQFDVANDAAGLEADSGDADQLVGRADPEREIIQLVYAKSVRAPCMPSWRRGGVHEILIV